MTKGRIRLLELIIATMLAMIVVVVYFSEKEAFEDLALGEETQKYYASDQSNCIHADQLGKEELVSIREGWELRGKRPVLLYLGNSQTHGINQMKEGEVSVNHLLYDQFRDDGIDVIAHSLPNANFQEFLLLYDFWKKELPVEYLVMPAFMDDMRETGIRSYLAENIRANESYQFSDASEIGEKIKAIVYPVKAEGEGDLAALKATTQEQTERYLNDVLDENIAAWSNRPNVRGSFFRMLYNSRNTLFGINAQTKRKMIPQTYSDNVAAINAIMKGANDSNIKTLFYIPPIRMDVEIPYLQEEYNTFKKDMENTASQYEQVDFHSFEKIIDGKYWGMKRSTNTSGKKEYDFMHFQYKGHQILADSLLPHLKQMLSLNTLSETNIQAAAIE